MAMDGDGRRNDESTVMDSGAQWQWKAQGQLYGQGWHISKRMTMDNEDGASATAMMSTGPTMEVTKANVASRH